MHPMGAPALTDGLGFCCLVCVLDCVVFCFRFWSQMVGVKLNFPVA